MRDRVAHEHEVDLALRLGDDLAVLRDLLEPPAVRKVLADLDARRRRQRGHVARRVLPRREVRREAGRHPLARLRLETGVERRLERVRPQDVAEGARMESVRHDLLRDRAARERELVVDVAPHDVASVGELDDLSVHDLVALTLLRNGAWKDRMQDDLRVGLLRAQCVQHPLDADDRVDRRFFGLREMPRVVRADHQHDRLRLVAVELAVGDSIENMLRAVARKSEVNRLVRLRRKCLVPDGLAAPVVLPEIGDRVAEENDLASALLLQLLRLVAELARPPLLGPVRIRRVRRDGADVRKSRRGNRGGETTDDNASDFHCS